MQSWQVSGILMVHQQDLMIHYLFSSHHFQGHVVIIGNQQRLECHISNLGSLLIQIDESMVEDIIINIRISLGLETIDDSLSLHDFYEYLR